jgi:serine/threonine protein kinase
MPSTPTSTKGPDRTDVNDPNDADEHLHVSDGEDPLTESSLDRPVIPHGARPVPSVGVWVGPADEPARYERLDHVGGGAEGAIYRARLVGRDAGSGQVVALKQYRPPPGASPSWPQDGTWLQVRDQAWLLGGLPRHRHLVRVREVFLGAVSPAQPGAGQAAAFDIPFVVMDWVEGRALSEVMRGRPPLASRLDWITQLAEAVDVLHSVSRVDQSPLVHGDIKPGNCLVTEDRGLVLVDTGAVQRADGTGDHRGLCTPPFAAPEVVQAPSRRRGVASDLFSVGAMAFFLLTGTPPPNAEQSDYATVAAATMRDCRDVPASARKRVAALVARLLDPDPGMRSRTDAATWAHELAALLTPRGIALRGRRGYTLAGIAAVAALGATLLPSVLRGPAATGGDTEKPCPDAPVAVSSPPPTSTAPLSPDSWPSASLSSLPALSAACGPVLYDADLTRPDAAWPVATTTDHTTGWTPSGFRMHVTGQGIFTPIPSPATVSAGDEIVSATAQVSSGQGAWGVWCRGVDAQATQRYEFLLSHAGAVQIIDGDGQYGTGWKYVTGLDMNKPVTLSARCADVIGAPVELTLAVDGRIALTYHPKIILGPGYSGVEGMTFSDVAGPTVTADYDHFDIRRPA